MLDSWFSAVQGMPLAFTVSLVLVLICGRTVIGLLARFCRETIRQDSARLAKILSPKTATPTMGGILILAGFWAAVFLCGNLADPGTCAMLVLSAGLGALGIWDDRCKRRADCRGLTARGKLLAQVLIAAPVVAWLALHEAIENDWTTLCCAMLLIVGMSNAVNLTDGLDGLACGCSLLVLVVAIVMSGALVTAVAPQVPLAALAGSVLGFAWFNRFPARVFMGDTGSLSLGGLLGLVIVLSDIKLPLILACGVFAVEAASVVLQVSWFKSTGRRVFLCAPLHHHFQFLGWGERRIVAHFWLAGLLCALVGCLVSVSANRTAASASAVPIRTANLQP